ncbi:MAG: hypothetical protein KatS3mg019_1832 [Fimbriimonadales bacterium]|nr:MAG: hypothetical protein KatS3mg019_1832 [Fimbriimonadales bacterium]
MTCAYCERPALYEARVGIQRLRLCDACAESWARRNLNVPLTRWLRQLKSPPQPHTECPFCHTTSAEIQQSGLYGCALCYVLLRNQ